MSTRICIFMISDVIYMQHLHIIHSRIVQIYRISVVCECRNNRLHSPHMLQSTRRPRPQPLTISRKNVQTSHARQCVINTFWVEHGEIQCTAFFTLWQYSWETNVFLSQHNTMQAPPHHITSRWSARKSCAC